MEILVEWIDGTYPSFNLSLATKEGKDPFLVVKGCKIRSGKDGEFVAGPSTKGKDDKYWNHTYMSKEFSAVVLAKAKEIEPKAAPEPVKKGHAMDDIDSDIPF